MTSILLMIHPCGDVVTYRKGEGWLAVEAYRDGYRALSERSNAVLSAAAAKS